jgi:FixJ family two-component response regulator
MSNVIPIVFVVDEDAAVRDSIEALILQAGLRSQGYGSALDFLAHPRPAAPSCVVLDVSLPDLNGLELQARLAVEHKDMPVIFITDCRDVTTSVRAMKAGALEFLTKPFDANDLMDAIRHAIERSSAALLRTAELRTLLERVGSLTPREREVMALVVSGRLNKQVGGELGISEITVKAHRGRVMRKMQAASLPHLVNMASRLTVTPALSYHRTVAAVQHA